MCDYTYIYMCVCVLHIHPSSKHVRKHVRSCVPTLSSGRTWVCLKIGYTSTVVYRIPQIVAIKWGEWGFSNGFGAPLFEDKSHMDTPLELRYRSGPSCHSSREDSAPAALRPLGEVRAPAKVSDNRSGKITIFHKAEIRLAMGIPHSIHS